MTENLINTEDFSLRLRGKSVDLETQRLLITNLINTEQENDLTEPANCNGFGRIRHFRRATSKGWPENPLPIDPACKTMGFPTAEILKAQVFQNASCNWRCWYCFVPFQLLAGNLKYSAWMSASDLIDLYLAENEAPYVIDLTGGQPDLVPEWVPWMMKELTKRGLNDQVYLWSDDNLSNDYFWRYLSDEDRQLVLDYKNYGRVCCFKGFDEESFSFNTKADPALFDNQFRLFERFVELGIDIYGYATFTTPNLKSVDSGIPNFIDKLQSIHKFLPLRVVPLEIAVFTPVKNRLTTAIQNSMAHQQKAIELWNREIEDRFSSTQREMNITDICLSGS
ncbi:hypothetical protein [uncultured Gimesia sp.]|uniref:hypothetical protein n=1 Tax=uncultured Gimesia sp. TaxID=1678688 RepID=UPI0030DADDEA|tara:strand:- start:37288 stop:38298 length:1011 start_codon:yes stop_codon:yes gene_type:complete